MKKYYYKITTEELKSAWVYCSQLLCTQYIIGKYVKPILKGSQSMVFSDSANAIKWKNNYWIHKDAKKLKLFKCEVKNPRRRKRIASSRRSNDVFMTLEALDDIIDFWNKSKSNKEIEKHDVPLGTVCVDAVKLIEEIG